jgi:hypothetical protein
MWAAIEFRTVILGFALDPSSAVACRSPLHFLMLRGGAIVLGPLVALSRLPEGFGDIQCPI